VISGGPGFGKTELLNGLKLRGFKSGDEAAREIISEQIRVKGLVVPWKNPALFQQEVLKRRIAFWESVEPEETAFTDRAIPDQIAFARYNGFKTPQNLLDAAIKYRYAELVFFTPPWKEIYQPDDIRKESYDEACHIHQILQETYLELGYIVQELPFSSVEKRIDHILTTINPTNNEF
jgi:predicted ATPase